MAKPGGKKTTEEITRLEASFRQDPEWSEFDLLADAYTRAGRFNEALNVCRQGLKVHPHHHRGHVAMGRALFGSGNLTKAVQVLRRCLTLEGAGSEPYRLLGEVLLWQDAAGQAVEVLEQAVSLGLAERPILVLLERARSSAEDQKTGVMVVGDRARGMGNLAVAGTIGGTQVDIEEGEEAVTESVQEVTRRVSRPPDDQRTPVAPDVSALRGNPDPLATSPGQEDPDIKTLPQRLIAPLATQMQPRPAGEHWAVIDGQWARELDAGSERFPDIESDVRGAHSVPRVRVDIPLAPLIDPLTDGMPPIPSEEESGIRPLEPNASEDSADGGPTRVTRVPFPEQPDDAAVTTEPGRPAGVTASPAPASASPPPAPVPVPRRVSPTPPAAPVSRKGPAVLHPPTEEVLVPDLEVRKTAELEQPTKDEKKPASSDGDHRLLVALAHTGPTDQDTGSHDLPAAGLTPDMSSSAPSSATALDYVVPVRRRRVFRLWILLAAACAVGGALGAAYWLQIRYRRAGDLAIERSTRARAEGTVESYQSALTALERLRSSSESVKREQELLAALGWLEYRYGQPPAKSSPLRTWPQALAQAAVALSVNDSAAAVAMLAGCPKEPANQALQSELLAWAAWLEGKRSRAEQEIDAALTRVPGLAGAHVLRGHLLREMRDLGGAEAAYRRALQVSAGHELAAMALLAVVLQREPDSAEVKEHLARPVRTAVGIAWQRVLEAERQALVGDPTSEALPAAVAGAMENPALLFHGTLALMQSGRFDAALATLDRMKRVRSDQDPAVQLLEVDLDIAQGLESRALEKLRARERSAQAKRAQALALALQGRSEEIEEILAGDDSEQARPLRLLSRLVKEKDASPAPLEAFAAKSSEARLAVVLLRMARGENASAARAAKELATCPWLRYRALTLQAQILFQERKIDEALALIDAVVRGSPRFMAARELLGQIYLTLGRHGESVQNLVLARQAGRQTKALLAALVKALALAGKAAEAASSLEEARKMGVSQAELAALGAYVRLAERRPDRLVSRDGSLDPSYLVALGELHLQSRRWVEAEAALKSALTADPTYPLTYLRLGELCLAQGKANASTYFSSAMRRVSSKAYYPRFILAQAHLGMARHQLAHRALGPELLGHLQAVIKNDPSSAEANRLLGEVHLGQSQWKDARVALEKAIILDPQDATALFLLGTAAKADRRRTQEALKRFLELEPSGKRAAVARRALKRSR